MTDIYRWPYVTTTEYVFFSAHRKIDDMLGHTATNYSCTEGLFCHDEIKLENDNKNKNPSKICLLLNNL